MKPLIFISLFLFAFFALAGEPKVTTETIRTATTNETAYTVSHPIWRAGKPPVATNESFRDIVVTTYEVKRTITDTGEGQIFTNDVPRVVSKSTNTLKQSWTPIR